MFKLISFKKGAFYLFCFLLLGLQACTVGKIKRTNSSASETPNQPITEDEDSGDNETAPTPNFSLLNADCFVPTTSTTPLFQVNEHVSPSLWNDPSVVRSPDGSYMMFLSSGNTSDSVVKIYRFTSSDGMSWTLSPTSPVFEKSSNGADWDSQAVETPSVVYFQNKYYMFYTGYTDQADTKTWKVGYATSSDGISWTRDTDLLLQPTDPNGAPNLDFNQFIVAEPGAVVANDTLYVYFSALGANLSVMTTLQVIGFVKTTDGDNWSSPQQTIVPDQTLYPRGSGWIGYSTPQPIYMNNKFHMFVDVVNDTPSWTQRKIHHLVSDDGETGWTHDTSEIFDRSDFSWTAHEIRGPMPLLIGTDLHLWFAGNSSSNPADMGFQMGIGHAKCSLSD